MTTISLHTRSNFAAEFINLYSVICISNGILTSILQNGKTVREENHYSVEVKAGVTGKMKSLRLFNL